MKIEDCIVSGEDQILIGKIVQRAVDMIRETKGYIPDHQTEQAMKIFHAHGGHCPLHLWRWLMSDQGAFAADFHGICTNLDPTTGVFRNGYWPAFAVRERGVEHA